MLCYALYIVWAILTEESGPSSINPAAAICEAKSPFGIPVPPLRLLDKAKSGF